ncbi:hypothetical protein BD289DRAFT_480747 [Coniella lustricola]|uniref:Uncharacterized protein n=1 Tax=Coniella lustricola TaxID=2025994 RepID=A0A2T3AEI0_9PEZI|nr:hypothetical protein BD289DRAFT_480747 [Coniella lustricola]
MASPTERVQNTSKPQRAASLQRMLEIERKKKMERMQQQPAATASGRRGVSPASNSSSGSRPGLLHRRRESSMTRQDDRVASSPRSISLPPLAVCTRPASRISISQDGLSRPMETKEIKEDTPSEPRRPDRDSLPSVAKAATRTHEPSNLKMVSFASDEDHDSDGSSICHSPTWDGFERKKRKSNDAKRKRLSKHPRPTAAVVDNRPVATKRTMSEPVLINQTPTSLDKAQSNQLSSVSQFDVSSPLAAPVLEAHGVQSVETIVKSPGFIGGVRLEREREAALKRLVNARASLAERPASEVLASSLQPSVDTSRKRETMAYPPTSTKTPFLKQAGQTRSRRGSLGNGLMSAAGKLFGTRDKDTTSEQGYSKKNASQESFNTVQSVHSSSQERGRQVEGRPSMNGRDQSYDSQKRTSSQKGEKRNRIGLPPLAWKNNKKNRTMSMIAVPPDSARDGSFFSASSPEPADREFEFLDRPFSPSVDGPLSPPASLSASLKAKLVSQGSSTSAASSTPRSSGKRKLKDALKTGFRSSSSTPTILRRSRSGTLDTLVGTDSNITSPRTPTQIHLANEDTTKDSGVDLNQGSHTPIGQRVTSSLGQHQSSVDPKDSGASSSSSHPDSESLPPSPITTPDTSRPQSSKDNDPFQTNSFGKGLSGFPQIDIDIPHTGTGSFLERPRTHSNSIVTEPFPDQQVSTSELWVPSLKPLDPDQLSFTSALTSIDVKKSLNDITSTTKSSAEMLDADVTPFSLNRGPKDFAPSPGWSPNNPDQSPKVIKNASQYFSSGPLDADFQPTSSQQFLPVRPRLGSNDDSEQRSISSRIRTDSQDSTINPAGRASSYLQDARRAGPSSPQSTAMSKANNSNMPGASSSLLAGPRGYSMASVPKAIDVAAHDLDKPIAKMLVECCHCRFYHDMPSRVYEAMAQPDDVVKDKRLGVSGQVTMCVKCPWCGHNMSTVCCAGYAAVVYLKEKLHGR